MKDVEDLWKVFEQNLNVWQPSNSGDIPLLLGELRMRLQVDIIELYQPTQYPQQIPLFTLLSGFQHRFSWLGERKIARP